MQSAGKLRLSNEVTQQIAGNGKKSEPEEVEFRDWGSWPWCKRISAIARARQNAATLPSRRPGRGYLYGRIRFRHVRRSGEGRGHRRGSGQDFPLDTMVQKLTLPQIHGRMELQRGNGAKAIEQLRPDRDLSVRLRSGGAPAYLRGLAYLQEKQGRQAMAEFQKLLDHKSSLRTRFHVFARAHSAWLAASRFLETPPKLASPIRISSPCGKTPTPIFLS